MNNVSTAKPNQGIDHVREQFHNLHEFVAVARARLDRNVWDYLIGGAETETTVRRNRLAIDSLAFRPRILRNVHVTDTSATFLKRKFTMPVALAPIGSIERFDPAATAAVANAAGSFGIPMFQSSVSKPDLEETGKQVPEGLKIFQTLGLAHNDAPAVRLADRLPVVGADPGPDLVTRIELHVGNDDLDAGHLLDPLKDVEAAPPAVALQRVGGVGDELQFFQNELRKALNEEWTLPPKRQKENSRFLPVLQ